MEKKSRRKPMTLAARVAAEVMGWEVTPDGSGRSVWFHCGLGGSGDRWTVNDPETGERWDPAENSADLFDVIGELRRRGLDLTIDVEQRLVFVEIFDSRREMLGCANAEPRGANTWQICLARAVCRAALGAVKEGGSDG